MAIPTTDAISTPVATTLETRLKFLVIEPWRRRDDDYNVEYREQGDTTWIFADGVSTNTFATVDVLRRHDL